MHFLQPIEYYEKALNIIRTKITIKKIYIISDDIEYCKEQEFFKTLVEDTCIWENSNEIDTFALMTICNGGAICANSTYSWWGAFLGAYAIKSPVIVPKKWYVNEPVSLFPNEWIVV
jgi:hypothetical protein